MGNAIELVEGLPTIEARVINFARILEERIFNSYLLFILFYSERGGKSQSINPIVEKGKEKMQEKRSESSKSKAVGER